MADVTLKHLEDYRKTWNGVPVTRRKRQERLRSFWLYCQRHKWVRENTAAHLVTIRGSQPPTLPLTKEQFASRAGSCEEVQPKRPATRNTDASEPKRCC